MTTFKCRDVEHLRGNEIKIDAANHEEAAKEYAAWVWQRLSVDQGAFERIDVCVRGPGAEDECCFAVWPKVISEFGARRNW